MKVEKDYAELLRLFNKNKKASKRKQDKVDLEILSQANKF